MQYRKLFQMLFFDLASVSCGVLWGTLPRWVLGCKPVFCYTVFISLLANTAVICRFSLQPLACFLLWFLSSFCDYSIAHFD